MTVIDRILAQGRSLPQELALTDEHDTLSFQQLAEAIVRTRDELRLRGVQPGDRIGLCLPDGVVAVVASLATLAVGAVHVPIDHHLAPPERALLSETTALTWLRDATGLQATGRLRPLDPLGPGRSAFLRFSSGTTGAAKGVLLSQSTLLARAEAAGRALDLRPGGRMLWLLPVAYHWAASVVAALVAGTGIVFGNRLRASGTAAIARAQGTTLAYASPWHCQRLAALSPGELDPLSDIICTTASLDHGLADGLRTRHGLRVRQALGVIECGLPLVSPGDSGEGPGEVGWPAVGFACRIQNPDSDGTGELTISGPGLFDAYLSPWRAASEVTQAGFFATGDRAQIHANGSIRLLGRLKDLINVGGVKVFPIEIETVCLAHPQVARCRAAAVADLRLGEVVGVTFTPTTDMSDPAALITELRHWCASRLAALKQPVHWKIADLPVTASGKVRRDDARLDSVQADNS